VISISECNIFEDTFPRNCDVMALRRKKIDVQIEESSREMESLRTAIEKFQLLREDL